MATREDLGKYIGESLRAGAVRERLLKILLEAGWPENEILEEFQKCEATLSAYKTPARGENDRKNKIIGALASLAVILVGINMFLFKDRLDLSKTNQEKVQQFYTQLSSSNIAFTDTGEMIFPDEQKFLDKKASYLSGKESFIEANLRTMTLTIYDKGAVVKEAPILTKGKKDGWWETPTGDYKILGKEVNHFSSIGKVWMPYSMQFYGNYFIHGWPHYDNGAPVAPSYSGGCIRLSNEDAKEVFNFAQKDTPVLVLGDEDAARFGRLEQKAEDAALPALSAKSFLVSNLSSGEIILEKNADTQLPIASLTKLMTAVVAHELIYLGRPIKAKEENLASALSVFEIIPGEYYTGFDLLYPLLMQSSNEAANVLASFIGSENFVEGMNSKAASLNMGDSRFADPSGSSAGDISTARDLSKLMQYIYFKRHFLLDISRGEIFESTGLVRIGNTLDIDSLKNFNEFSGNPTLVGMKNGETIAAKQTIATVWNVSGPGGSVPVGIIVLNSQNRVKDTENLLSWVKNNFEVK